MEGNLKETELRLGPPSPVREKANGVEDSATSSATSELSLLSAHPEKKLFVDEEEKQPPQNGGGFWSSGIVGNKASGAKRGFAQTIDVRKMGTWGFGTEKPNVLPIESGKNNNNGGILTSPKAGSVGLWSSEHHGSFLSGSRTNGQVGSGGVNNLNGSGSRVDNSRESVTQKMEVSAQKPIPTEDRPAPKAQVVGWPPIRSFRKNSLAPSLKPTDESESKPGSSTLYVKVSMDGAPYLRKVDLKLYSKYQELSSALENMFSGFTLGPYGANGAQGRDGLSESKLKDLLNGSEYVLTYEDKDGDWMLVGDVPWEMFVDSCKRMRIMKSSEAIGLAPRAMEKCKNRS